MTTALVAAAGGHLAELVRLRARLDLDTPPLWITSESEQATTLLDGERIAYAVDVPPRGYAALAKNVPLARRVLREHGIERMISTGSGIALSFLPLAQARGVSTHYIESAARVHGPSLTGRILSLVPGAKLYTQDRRWERGRWRYAGSVYDGYEPGPERPAPARLKVAVSVGTLFGFRRMIERLVAVLPPDAEVLCWQTGDTDLDGLSIPGRRIVPLPELRRAFGDADVVVTHAGVGAALEALDSGHRPLLVPRLRHHREHVDDHQVEIAEELARRGLAVARQPEDLTTDDVIAAAARTVRPATSPPPVRLV